MNIKTLIIALTGMTNLKTDKRYHIKISNNYYHFMIGIHPKGFYLDCLNGDNDCLFTLSKINPEYFTRKTLGYYMYGIFPFCKTIDDLTTLLYELLKEMENRGFTFTCNFEYKDFNYTSCWND